MLKKENWQEREPVTAGKPVGEKILKTEIARSVNGPKLQGHHACKEYISTIQKYPRKLYLQHEQHPHERWGQTWHKLHQQAQWRKHQHAQVSLVSTAHKARSLRCTPLNVVSHAPHDSRCSWVFIPSHRHTWASLFDLDFFLFYFDLSFSVFFHFSILMLPEPHTDLNNLITMQHNLRNSAKEINNAYDVNTSLTGYEPNDMVFNELDNSQAIVIGLGHRRRYARQAARRSTQRICQLQQSWRRVCRHYLLCSMEQGNLWEKEMSINQLVLMSRETRTVLTASFLKTHKLRKWSMEQGNLWEKVALQMHRLGPYLMNRGKWIPQSIAIKLVITNSKQLEPKKNPAFYKKNYGVSKRIFVKFTNKVYWEFQSSTFVTFARRKLIEDQNTAVESSGRLQE